MGPGLWAFPMNIEISHDKNSGRFSVSFKRHALVALALTLVSGGIAMMTGPWWQPLVVGLIEHADIEINTTSQWILGPALIAMGVGLIFFKHFVLDRRLEGIATDRLLIAAFAMQPDRIRNFLSGLQGDCSFRSRAHDYFHAVCVGFQAPERSFQSAKAREAYERFSGSASQLEGFLAQHFWVYPNDQGADADQRYCLAPRLDMDREMISYDASKSVEFDALRKKLVELTANVNSNFDDFIGKLKALGVFD